MILGADSNAWRAHAKFFQSNVVFFKKNNEIIKIVFDSRIPLLNSKCKIRLYLFISDNSAPLQTNENGRLP